jgi:hypothetical protein
MPCSGAVEPTGTLASRLHSGQMIAFTGISNLQSSHGHSFLRVEAILAIPKPMAHPPRTAKGTSQGAMNAIPARAPVPAVSL